MGEWTGVHWIVRWANGGAQARAASGKARNGQAVSQRETLDKPGWPARRGTAEQAAQSEMRSELCNNNETPSWLGHASTRFGKEVKCQRKTGGGAITAPPTNQRSGDPRPIVDTSGQYSGAQSSTPSPSSRYRDRGSNSKRVLSRKRAPEELRDAIRLVVGGAQHTTKTT